MSIPAKKSATKTQTWWRKQRWMFWTATLKECFITTPHLMVPMGMIGCCHLRKISWAASFYTRMHSRSVQTISMLRWIIHWSAMLRMTPITQRISGEEAGTLPRARKWMAGTDLSGTLQLLRQTVRFLLSAFPIRWQEKELSMPVTTWYELVPGRWM